MTPPDFVKEWREKANGYKDGDSKDMIIYRAIHFCADQLEKALEDKVVVDREKLGRVLQFLRWLGSESETDPPIKLVDCVEIFETFLPQPKETNGKRP